MADDDTHPICQSDSEEEAVFYYDDNSVNEFLEEAKLVELEVMKEREENKAQQLLREENEALEKFQRQKHEEELSQEAIERELQEMSNEEREVIEAQFLESPPVDRSGLSQEQIKKFTVLKCSEFKKLCSEGKYKEFTFPLKCPITLSEIEDKDDVIILTCNHVFSYDSCIMWFKNNQICPVCRKEF